MQKLVFHRLFCTLNVLYRLQQVGGAICEYNRVLNQLCFKQKTDPGDTNNRRDEKHFWVYEINPPYKRAHPIRSQNLLKNRMTVYL